MATLPHPLLNISCTRSVFCEAPGEGSSLYAVECDDDSDVEDADEIATEGRKAYRYPSEADRINHVT